MDRVHLAQSKLRHTEKFFEEQFAFLNMSRAIQGPLLQSQLRVTGLFYRAEVGVFCHYDSNNKKFRALLPK